ncbi:ATP-binding protein [Enterobacter hormaechei]|uniref:ATP-binding protein n=1 Tax=Enterobacter hormaechei TaxID=158836 RepID=UPI0007935005|nr:ATP-binding protein [Enterobacter hormaechei]SAE87830.1 Histidine kinase-%2C DNA gyrase B-%2C and HSP90-like ATPase [Enterobacter hormaechei]HCM9744455.1 ATP-binding protein [Enterobacter hormaechei subsp. steigerwaltii]HCM9747087.1 ATP-binding protein [Enterobacter hormaechei subsp. steigerwaltii]
MTNVVDNKINANPTKEFFIEMLTRDIALDRAILDLIDNSVDAARQVNKPDSWIRLNFDTDKFEIYDNCGGMDKHLAQTYAFRFGRPSNSPKTPNSVGQFGVGMKRTLFKLGKNFVVESKNKGKAFKISINVDEWKSREEKDWTFDIEDVTDTNLNDGETRITVTDLYNEISSSLTLETFENSLSNEVSYAHFKSINKGLKIFINEKPVSEYNLTLLHSDEIQPYKRTFDVGDVHINITAGISNRDIKKGGWYIVCNGRLVENCEQTSITGWGVEKIPQYHADYAFFRGIVEFDCSNSSKLPWTTTKTGVDKDNPIYTAALYHMKNVMREVIAFLKGRAKEDNQFKESLLDQKPLNDAITNAIREKKTITPSNAIFSDRFIAPDPVTPLSEPKETSIQYKVLTKDINKVKESLGITSNKEVGEKTFNYYMEYEC